MAGAVAVTVAVPLAFIVAVVPEIVRILVDLLAKVTLVPEVHVAERAKVLLLKKVIGLVGLKLIVWVAGLTTRFAVILAKA